MEKVETALDVLSRAATMVQPCPAYPASDSDSFETPSTASSGESEGDRTLSPETPRSQSKELTGKWRRERRSTRLPDYRPRDNCKMALRSQSFNERRTVVSASLARAQPHSDGELSDEQEEGPANLTINGNRAPPEYPGSKHEVPIDMRLRARPAPPPYIRPSVITKNSDSPPPGSMSMCDPVIDEHFRRSLGDDYMNLFKKNNEDSQPGPKPNTKDRASSPIQFKLEEPPKPAKIIAMEVDDASLSVDDHFAKALGDTWKKLQSSRLKDNEKPNPSKGGVDDHFSKALGDTWKQIQSAKHKLDADNGKSRDQTKIITRSGVVI